MSFLPSADLLGVRLDRRAFLVGAGFAALGADPGRRLPEGPPPRCRRVVWLHMEGGPPQHDLFDWKPELQKHTGKICPRELIAGDRFAFVGKDPKLLGTPYRFAQHGECGMWVSELLPYLARVVDRLTFMRSMRTHEFNHAPAQLLLHTGAPRVGRPSMGAWVAHALGSENRDLPPFVVLVSGGRTPSAGASVWGHGFLPAAAQGVPLRSQGDPVLFLRDPDFLDRAGRRRTLDAMRDLDALRAAAGGDPESAEARAAQNDLAFRMQAAVPEAVDLGAEPDEVLAMYGADPARPSYANHCLLARRLVERGVRFVQLYDWGWDVHGTAAKDDLITQLPRKCREVDRPTAALILDLAQRGLLDDTLVVWSGEFGRTPMNEERGGSKLLGRDHHPHAFTVFLAGGGVRAGHVHGETDDLGYHVVRDPVHVHDLQATVLHLLGIDHRKLTHRFQGRDFRLTDEYGRVVTALLA